MAGTQRGSSTHKAATGGHFELAIDGHATTAYLKTVDGGYIRAGLMDEPIGPENHRIKHTSVVSIEPFSVELRSVGRERRAALDPAVVAQGVVAPKRRGPPRELRPLPDVHPRVLRRARHRDDVPHARRWLEGTRRTQGQDPARARRHRRRSTAIR